MKKATALLVMVCVLASLASFALAQGAAEPLLAQVDDCEYKIVGFGPSTYEYSDPAETDGMTGFALRVEITKEPETYITYHPNLVYDGGEAGVRVRVLSLGGGVSASMGFDPEDLYQTEDISVSEGGGIVYQYLIPEGKEPLQIVFYDSAQAQAAAFDAATLPAMEAE